MMITVAMYVERVRKYIASHLSFISDNEACIGTSAGVAFFQTEMFQLGTSNLTSPRTFRFFQKRR